MKLLSGVFVAVAMLVLNLLMMVAATTIGNANIIDSNEKVMPAQTGFKHSLEIRDSAGGTVPFISPVSPIPDPTSVTSSQRTIVPFIPAVSTIPDTTSVSSKPLLMSPVPTIPDTSSESGSRPMVPFISAVSTIPDPVTSNTSDQITTTKGQSWSPQSGFWASSDPFPVTTPSTFTMSRTMKSSTSDNSDDTSTGQSTKLPIADSASTSSTTIVPSTSISTAVTYVIASPTPSAQAAQAPTSSSKGWSNTFDLDSWIVIGIVMAAQGLF